MIELDGASRYLKKESIYVYVISSLSLEYLPCADPEWGIGVRTPLDNHKLYGFIYKFKKSPDSVPTDHNSKRLL